jgi:hypothetical protein
MKTVITPRVYPTISPQIVNRGNSNCKKQAMDIGIKPV